MEESALLRTPYEVWELIIQEAIALASGSFTFFDVSCTPSSYLAFKKTCGTGSGASRQWAKMEKQRYKLTLVCRAWHALVERWATTRQFILCEYHPNPTFPISDGRWRTARRITFGRSRVGEVILTWKAWGASGVWMYVRKLEIRHVPKENFEDIFNALCESSTAMPYLRSLGLSVRTGKGSPFRKISLHFPRLVHLTIFDDDIGTNYQRDDALELRELECLFLFSYMNALPLSAWTLPVLRHVNNDLALRGWKSNLLPFLMRHRSIETLDLGRCNLATKLDDATICGFWDIFPCLGLLRCGLSGILQAFYPERPHPLRFLVNTDKINDRRDLIKALKPWAGEKRGIKLESLMLVGPYLGLEVPVTRFLQHWRDKETVQILLSGLQKNRTKLLVQTGEDWPNSWFEVP